MPKTSQRAQAADIKIQVSNLIRSYLDTERSLRNRTGRDRAVLIDAVGAALIIQGVALVQSARLEPDSRYPILLQKRIAIPVFEGARAAKLQ